jgi:nucleoid-associated protein YgaU
MKKILLVASIILLFGLAIVMISAQSIKDNADYQKALEYQKMAEDSMAAGDYDKAYEYAMQAEAFSKKAGDAANALLVKYQANSLIAYLENQFSTMNKDKAQKDFADDYTNLMNDYNAAKTSYGAEDYQASLDSGKKAKDELDKLIAAMANGTTVAQATPVPEATQVPVAIATEAPIATEPPQVTSNDVYPKYYKVVWDPKDRDCLWKIAGYTFVFNNPFKWRLLYEVNKAKFVYPDNPRFISPEQVLEIPSIAGETREGTYDPSKKYPVIQK